MNLSWTFHNFAAIVSSIVFHINLRRFENKLLLHYAIEPINYVSRLIFLSRRPFVAKIFATSRQWFIFIACWA